MGNLEASGHCHGTSGIFPIVAAVRGHRSVLGPVLLVWFLPQEHDPGYGRDWHTTWRSHKIWIPTLPGMYVARPSIHESVSNGRACTEDHLEHRDSSLLKIYVRFSVPDGEGFFLFLKPSGTVFLNT